MTDSPGIRRGDVVRLRRPKATGNEIKKDRPWVVLTPDDMNRAEFTIIVAPLTRGSHPYRYRVECAFGGAASHIVLDQIETVHFRRVRKRLGAVSPQALSGALAKLREMFAE